MPTRLENLKKKIKQEQDKKISPLEEHFMKWFYYCKIYGYEREYKVLNFYLDFAWPEIKFAVEADGDLFHFDRKEKDNQRDNQLKKQGWTIMRINSKDAWNPLKFVYYLEKIFFMTNQGNYLPFAIMEIIGGVDDQIKRMHYIYNNQQKTPEHNNNYTGYCGQCGKFYFYNIPCGC
jgi:very-short-patch-repair endonuclease